MRLRQELSMYFGRSIRQKEVRAGLEKLLVRRQ